MTKKTLHKIKNCWIKYFLGLLSKIGHFGKYHNTLCLSPQFLHKHCFQFLLGLTYYQSFSGIFWCTEGVRSKLKGLVIGSPLLLLLQREVLLDRPDPLQR